MEVKRGAVVHGLQDAAGFSEAAIEMLAGLLRGGRGWEAGGRGAAGHNWPPCCKFTNQPRSDLRNAALATAPMPMSAMPWPGAVPTVPSGWMNFVLPFGKTSTCARGRSSACHQSDEV